MLPALLHAVWKRKNLNSHTLTATRLKHIMFNLKQGRPKCSCDKFGLEACNGRNLCSSWAYNAGPGAPHHPLLLGPGRHPSLVALHRSPEQRHGLGKAFLQTAMAALRLSSACESSCHSCSLDRVARSYHCCVVGASQIAQPDDKEFCWTHHATWPGTCGPRSLGATFSSMVPSSVDHGSKHTRAHTHTHTPAALQPL